MSIARIIRHADCEEVPWKNGGGTTREIAVFPPGAGMGDFLWRLSMARVEHDGPFSAFDGVDRVLTVLDGVLELRDPGAVIRLSDTSAPYPFAGDLEIIGGPIDTPVLDLNAMVRRGQYRVEVHRTQKGDVVPCDGTAFLVALEPQAVSAHHLDRWDCCELAGPITAQGRALRVAFVRLDPSVEDGSPS